MEKKLKMSKEKLHIVVLTGAGMSAESGIKTFRDANGLWENHDIMDVASPQGWHKNRALVLEFYNQRRSQLQEVSPNAGHMALADLEQHFDVSIVTQNVDDLHERAGSSYIHHLHGELVKVRSTLDSNLVYTYGYKRLEEGDKCEKGSQLRPHIVWFGEAVPAYPKAEEICRSADILLVVGTSLQVYPAAGLVHCVPDSCAVYLVDPQADNLAFNGKVQVRNGFAAVELPKLVSELVEKYG